MGNPFFLEELAWAVCEGKNRQATMPIPDTVQAVLAARVDRLPPAEKHLLQAAAVIGPEVSIPLLQAITEVPEETLADRLRHLQAAEFLYETRLVPEQTYTFKHVLTQEVAYQSLLHSTRRQVHRQIAQVLEERFPMTVETAPALLAQHYTAAGLYAQAIPIGSGLAKVPWSALPMRRQSAISRKRWRYSRCFQRPRHGRPKSSRCT